MEVTNVEVRGEWWVIRRMDVCHIAFQGCFIFLGCLSLMFLTARVIISWMCWARSDMFVFTNDVSRVIRVLGAGVAGLVPRGCSISRCRCCQSCIKGCSDFQVPGLPVLYWGLLRFLGAGVASLAPRVVRIFRCQGCRTCTEVCSEFFSKIDLQITNDFFY